MNGRFEAIGGEVWVGVHSPDRCGGETCVMHNPSQHAMREWPMHLRETGLVERICEHGVGHPDPDSAAFFDNHGPLGSRGSWTIHGCDGCCVSVLLHDCPDCGVPPGAVHGRWCDMAICHECVDQRIGCECGNSDINWDDVWPGRTEFDAN